MGSFLGRGEAWLFSSHCAGTAPTTSPLGIPWWCPNPFPMPVVTSDGTVETAASVAVPLNGIGAWTGAGSPFFDGHVLNLFSLYCNYFYL